MTILICLQNIQMLRWNCYLYIQTKINFCEQDLLKKQFRNFRFAFKFHQCVFFFHNRMSIFPTSRFMNVFQKF